MISAEVERRRAHGIDADEHPDVLSALLVGADDEKLTDAEVLDQVRSLIAAGYDTTSAAAAWVVHALGRNPEALAAVRAEVEAVIGDRPPTLDDLRQLPTVDGVVREVLRLWPPGFVAGRGSIADCEIAGHVVPGGSTVLYSAYVTGRDPELWPDPDRFDPGRWAPGQPDPPPYAFVPFGGGARRCIGFALATLELQVLVTRLAQRARWRLERPDAKPTGIASAVPKGGVPITDPLMVGPLMVGLSEGLDRDGERRVLDPAVDLDDLAGDPRGRVAGQVDDAGRDVLHLADPAHRGVLLQLPADRVVGEHRRRARRSPPRPPRSR